jgi:hypothetical protein
MGMGMGVRLFSVSLKDSRKTVRGAADPPGVPDARGLSTGRDGGHAVRSGFFSGIFLPHYLSFSRFPGDGTMRYVQVHSRKSTRSGTTATCCALENSTVPM